MPADSSLVSFVPEAAVFDLPMVFSKYDGDTIDGVLNGDSAFRTELSSAFDAAGFHYLGILQNATYRLTTANKELNTLADFKALQIRTMNNSNHMAFWTAIGAEPTLSCMVRGLLRTAERHDRRTGECRRYLRRR